MNGLKKSYSVSRQWILFSANKCTIELRKDIDNQKIKICDFVYVLTHWKYVYIP